ncbi:MAG TPA: SpoIIE family protein phosphatase [Terriglobales bacterium]|jgi:serine phosphatase RsbU (regulator of sigma subunit)|nr:SpoIIE family protein phosphatase [Terriglobales bacterium]
MRFLFRHEKPAVLAREPVHADVPELADAELAAIYYGQRMAGDFYDFIRVSPNRVVFGLLDVAGPHDDNREIIMAAQRTFRSLAAELLAKPEANEAEAMVRLCIQLNRTILQAEGGGVRSCPAFAGCYNEGLGTVSYFNAGHTPGLLCHSSGVAELGATGLPLGLFSHATCDAAMVALEPGAALLVVSRGIVEGRCNGNEFGLEGVKTSLEGVKAGSATALCTTILDRVQQFMCKPPTHDDVTALALLRMAEIPATRH